MRRIGVLAQRNAISAHTTPLPAIYADMRVGPIRRHELRPAMRAPSPTLVTKALQRGHDNK